MSIKSLYAAPAGRDPASAPQQILKTERDAFVISASLPNIAELIDRGEINAPSANLHAVGCVG